jgi:hypothetical protein
MMETAPRMKRPPTEAALILMERTFVCRVRSDVEIWMSGDPKTNEFELPTEKDSEPKPER